MTFGKRSYTKARVIALKACTFIKYIFFDAVYRSDYRHTVGFEASVHISSVKGEECSKEMFFSDELSAHLTFPIETTWENMGFDRWNTFSEELISLNATFQITLDHHVRHVSRKIRFNEKLDKSFKKRYKWLFIDGTTLTFS